ALLVISTSFFISSTTSPLLNDLTEIQAGRLDSAGVRHLLSLGGALPAPMEAVLRWSFRSFLPPLFSRKPSLSLKQTEALLSRAAHTATAPGTTLRSEGADDTELGRRSSMGFGLAPPGVLLRSR